MSGCICLTSAHEGEVIHVRICYIMQMLMRGLTRPRSRRPGQRLAPPDSAHRGAPAAHRVQLPWRSPCQRGSAPRCFVKRLCSHGALQQLRRRGSRLLPREPGLASERMETSRQRGSLTQILHISPVSNSCNSRLMWATSYRESDLFHSSGTGRAMTWARSTRTVR